MKAKSTMKDVQKITHLSLSTISRYFNGEAVREENKKKIEAATKTLNYKLNQFARSLKTNKSRIIGFLVPMLDSEFSTSLIVGIEDLLRAHGYGVIVCDSRYNPKLAVSVLDFLIDKNVDGIITIPNDVSGKYLQPARDENIPVVLIDQLTQDFAADAVIVNNRDAAKKAVAEFVRNGHERIGMIAVSEKTFSMNERYYGFCEAIEANALDKENCHIEFTDMAIDSSYAAMKALLQNAPSTTAVFLSNYEITIGAVMALNDLNLQMGKDISVIGFDNQTLAAMIRPKLTIIAQPMASIAKEAAQLMINRLNNPEPDEKTNIVSLPTSLIQGNSVCKIK